MPSSEEWFATWFDSPYYDILYRHRDDAEAQHFIDNLLSHLHPHPGSRILDMACGTGRHAWYLSTKGYEVTGIDLSFRSIKLAKERENERLNFYEHDIRNYFRINYFDVILNLFTSIGYFASERDNMKALRAAHLGLRENGVMVIDFFNAAKVMANLVHEEHKLLEGVDFHITRAIENGFIVKDIRFDADGRQHHYQERVKALNLDDFKRYFQQCGFKLKEVFGDYSLNAYDANMSDRLIMIADK